jgi:hypothetical protein
MRHGPYLMPADEARARGLGFFRGLLVAGAVVLPVEVFVIACAWWGLS